MAQLISENPFVLFVREFENVESWPRYYGILTSYAIMRAKVINLLGEDEFSVDLVKETNVGTIVHIDTEKNIQAALPLVPKGIRYFGYINATEGFVTNSLAYVGLPISLNYVPELETPEGMWEVVYPNITLSSLKTNKELGEYVKMIGRAIEVKLCDDVVRTEHTMSYSAQISGEVYHMTRCVARGKAPSIAKKEMVGKGTNCDLSLVVYSVLM
jgi:hypothetical protein